MSAFRAGGGSEPPGGAGRGREGGPGDRDAGEASVSSALARSAAAVVATTPGSAPAGRDAARLPLTAPTLSPQVSGARPRRGPRVLPVWTPPLVTTSSCPAWEVRDARRTLSLRTRGRTDVARLARPEPEG